MARPRTLARSRVPLTFEDRAFIAELERVLTPPKPEPARAVVERVQKRVLTIHASNPDPGSEFVFEVLAMSLEALDVLSGLGSKTPTADCDRVTALTALVRLTLGPTTTIGLHEQLPNLNRIVRTAYVEASVTSLLRLTPASASADV